MRGLLLKLYNAGGELQPQRWRFAVSATVLFCAPHTDWLPETVARDASGHLLTGRDLLAPPVSSSVWPLARRPLAMESSLPGVFAAGDIRAGSLGRVASATGDFRFFAAPGTWTLRALSPAGNGDASVAPSGAGIHEVDVKVA